MTIRKFGTSAAAWLLSALSLACTPAWADGNLGSMFSDLWWNRTESGWGVTVDHEDQVMFVTIYIYRADNAPYWVVATLDHVAGSHHTFAGELYETKGPWFGGPFNTVTPRKVGTAAFSAADPMHATVSYTVDGTPVSKTIERQTLRHGANFSGTYLGAITFVTSNCANPADNGEVISDAGPMMVAHNGSNMLVTYSGTEASCTFSGSYSHVGALGSAAMSMSCTGGIAGTFNLANMQWTIAGMSASVSGRQPGCDFSGSIVGATMR